MARTTATSLVSLNFVSSRSISSMRAKHATEDEAQSASSSCEPKDTVNVVSMALWE